MINLKDFFGSNCQKGDKIKTKSTVFVYTMKFTGKVEELNETVFHIVGKTKITQWFHQPIIEEVSLTITLKGDTSAACGYQYGSTRGVDEDAYYYVKKNSFYISANIDDDPEDDVFVKIWKKGAHTGLKITYEKLPAIKVSLR